MAERFISDVPTPEELERLLAELPEPPAEAVQALRRDFELSEHASATSAGAEWPPGLQELQGKADVRYAERPTSDRPMVGPALVFAKRVFRLVGQPFINEALRKQVEFNKAILAGVGQLYESLQQHQRNQALARAELESRLERLERLERERQAERVSTAPALETRAKKPPATAPKAKAKKPAPPKPPPRKR